MPPHCHGMVWTSSSPHQALLFDGIEGGGECVGLDESWASFLSSVILVRTASLLLSLWNW